MSLPINLHGNVYAEHLRAYRDQALIESNWYDGQMHLGRLSVGTATAVWLTDEGGEAYLYDINVCPVQTNLHPTTLRLSHQYGDEDSGSALTSFKTFKMMLDGTKPSIKVYRTIETPDSPRLDVLKAWLARPMDRKWGLSEPTKGERELLYTEMQRGATGLFKPHDHEDDED